MKREVKMHVGYVEFELAKETGIDLPELFGKYQFIFSSKKGKISMIQLKNQISQRDMFWEIYCLEGDLFKDTERFDSKILAEKRVREFLE